MRSIRSTRFCRPYPQRWEEMRNTSYEPTHLSSPRREVLERPPDPVFFFCLLDLLGDLHGG